jgi:hypothetical protein
MGTNEFHPASQGAEDDAQVHPRKSGGYCEGCVSGLGQDDGGRESRRDSCHGGEAQMDNQAWRGELEAREEGHQLLDDVQVERSHLGATWRRRSLRELEVSFAALQ